MAWRRKQYDQASSVVDDDETSSLVEEIDDTSAARESNGTPNEKGANVSGADCDDDC